MTTESAPGWDALQVALATVRAELVAAAPDAATAAEAETYLLRVLTAALNDAFLPHLFRAGDLTRVLPTRGAPSPDYLMWFAGIDPSRRCRLEGCLQDSERVGIGLYRFSSFGALEIDGYAVVDPTTVGPDGRFSLDITAEAAGPGGLRTTPETRALIVRILHRAADGFPAVVTMSGEASKPARTGAAQRKLEQVGSATLHGIRQFLRWSELLSAAPNRLLDPPAAIAAEVQGDPDTVYRLGYYALGENEWLHVTIPSAVHGYWSLYAYNHWCEILPGAGFHDRSVAADADGHVRIHIGPSPSADGSNWIDTLGRSRGMLIFRAIGATDIPALSAQVRSDS